MVDDTRAITSEVAYTLSRRALLAGLAVPAAGMIGGVAAGASARAARASYVRGARALPPPRLDAGSTFMQAVAARRSTRSFAPTPLDDQVLGDVLYCAFGINRPDSKGHTAPSWHGSAETEVHVATADGVGRYDPPSHSIEAILDKDIRRSIGMQPYVETAPVVLIYIADKTRMYEAADAEHELFARVDSAMAAQNVYLAAAAFGLATVLIGSIRAAEISRLLKLPTGRIVTFGQPIGEPA